MTTNAMTRIELNLSVGAELLTEIIFGLSVVVVVVVVVVVICWQLYIGNFLCKTELNYILI